MRPSSRERGRADASSCLSFRGSRLMEAKKEASGCLGSRRAQKSKASLNGEFHDVVSKTTMSYNKMKHG
jgi:hypothetical protein